MQLFDTTQLTEDLAVRSFAANLVRMRQGGANTLFALSGLATERMCDNVDHGYFTKTDVYPAVTVDGAHLANATTLTVLSTDFIIPNTILMHQEDGSSDIEAIFVESIDSATEITVVRGHASTNAVDITDTLIMPEIGSAFEQGSDAPISRSIHPQKYNNSTQIFRTTWGNSRTLAGAGVEVGDGPQQENRRDCSFFHEMSIERALWFGQGDPLNPIIKNGKPMTTMRGIYQTIKELAPGNVNIANATTNLEELEAMTDDLFDIMPLDQGENIRTIWCGSIAYKVFNQIGLASGVYQLMEGQTNFGMTFKTFQTTRGKFEIIESTMMNTNPTWRKMAFIMDLSYFDVVWYKNGRTTHREIGKDSGVDAMAGVLTSELTCELMNPLSCGIILNLTRGVAVP